MKNRGRKGVAMLAILCLLVMAFAVPMGIAASYSKVYGQTQAKVRVRESASTNATIIDNIIKNACVYVTSSKTSGSNTFIQVKYRADDGTTQTGWICQSDGKETYVKILSAAQAQSAFSVKDGDLPSKKVGTFTAAQRKASAEKADSTYVSTGSSGETVKSVQTKLKELGFYDGSITGNVGTKTEKAIKDFQTKYGLTADGVAGPQTIAKIDAVWAEKGTTSSVASSGSSLKLGSTGTKVRTLQQNLTTLGFYWADITGNFGSKTETAVKRFQEENGLKADGIAGDKTLAAIEAAVAKKGGATVSSGNAASGATTLKLNSQGTAVSTLQQNLKQLGYYYADITGNFGSKTEAAVKKFQTDKGLTSDGVAGAKTLNAVAAAIEKAGGSSAGTATGTSGSGLRLGSTGDKVRALQQDLTTLGYYYGDITGHYGSMTQTAVTKFQKARGLTQDGVAGSSTLSAIASAVGSGSAVSGGSTNAGTSLKEGDSGSAVTDLQTRLKALKYYYGDITGHYGSLTKKAVRKFQDDNNLTVDGIAGTSTINKLRSLTGGGSTISNGGSGGTTVSDSDSYGRIAKDNVNLRKSYSTTSSAVASLSKGTRVRITKTYTVNNVNWYYVSVNVGSYNYKGYVRADMVEKTTASDFGNDDIDIGDQEILGMIRVTANNVRLRDGAGTDAKVVGTAGVGDVFYYIDTTEGWFETKAGYWISKDFVKVMTDEEVDDYVGSGSNSTASYDLNDTGSMVRWIQETLYALGYYENDITGHYGKQTKEAVRQFQIKNGLSADGVCGAKTIAKMSEIVNKDVDSTVDQKYNPIVYSLSWFANKATYSSDGLSRGKTCTVTDISTGRSFKIKVQSIGNHADVEPLTKADTAVLCSLYNVSSANQLVTGNKYQRRPMVLTTEKNVQYVCSIYAIPHGTNTISNNGFDGQFCLHFKDSKTHGSDRVDTDKNGHQEMISRGESKLKEKGIEIKTSK